MKQIVRAFTLLLAGLLIASCGSKSPEEHVSKAQDFFEKNKYRAAVIELKNALKQDGSYQQARLLLGQVYFKAGDVLNAEKELSVALNLGVSSEKIYPLYSQVLLATGRHDDLLAIPENGLTNDGLSTVLAAKASAALLMGNTVEARELIRQATASKPVSVYAAVTAARFSLYEGLYSKARTQLDDVFSTNDVYPLAWSLLGDVEIQEGHLDKAEVAFTKAIELDSNNVKNYYKRALVRINKGDLAAIKEDVLVLQKLAPEHPSSHLLAGIVKAQEGNFDDAKISFEKASLGGNKYPQAYYYLAAVHLKQGNLSIARKNINLFLNINPHNAVGARLAATLDFQRKDFVSAEERLRPIILSDSNDFMAVSLLAKVLLAQGKNDEGMDLLIKAADLKPGSPQALTEVGAGFIAAGEHDVGLKRLHAALELDPQYQQADLVIVNNYLVQRDFESAIVATNDYKNRHPDKVEPLNLLGRIYFAMGDRAKAKESWLAALSIEAGNPAAGHSLANLAVQDKNNDEARKIYQNILDNHPDYLQTLLNLSALDALEGKEKPMVEKLAQAIKAHPHAISPRLVLARYYLLKNQLHEVATIVDGFSEDQKKIPDVLFIISSLEIDQKNFASANASLNELVSLQPDEAKNHFLLARSYTGLGNVPEAILALKKTVELEPNHFYARLALARLYLLSKEKGLFAEQLDLLRNATPEHPEVLQLEAALANSNEDKAGALKLLESVFEKNPSPKTVLTLAIQRRVAGDLDGGIVLLESWIAEHQGDLPPRIALAEFYSVANQTKNAINQYKGILTLDAGNVSALNNLAWHLRDSNPKKALVYAEKANSIATESASVLDTLAIVLLKNNSVVKARRKIDQAAKIAPNNPSVRYHDVLVSVAEGDLQKAIGKLQVLIDADVPFSERSEAVALLAKLQ